MTRLQVNGESVELDVPSDMPLLWALRDGLGLTGTKYGCGEGQCGACTVHLDGDAVRSCRVPVSEAAGRSIITIEGLAAGRDHPVRQAWLAERVVQCGYCQPGQIMTAAAFLAKNPAPTPTEIDAAMSGVLCRCGTYQRIRAAVQRAADRSRS